MVRFCRRWRCLQLHVLSSALRLSRIFSPMNSQHQTSVPRISHFLLFMYLLFPLVDSRLKGLKSHYSISAFEILNLSIAGQINEDPWKLWISILTVVGLIPLSLQGKDGICSPSHIWQQGTASYAYSVAKRSRPSTLLCFLVDSILIAVLFKALRCCLAG